jgi:hypothetical protein
MTDTERKHQLHRDPLLVEMAAAVEMMLELTRHVHLPESMIGIAPV